MFRCHLVCCLTLGAMFVPANAFAADQCQIGADNFPFAREHRLERPFRDSPRATWGPEPETIPYREGMAACRSDLAWEETRVLSSADYWIQQKVNYCHHHLPTWTPEFQRGYGYPKPNDEERPDVCNYAPAPNGEQIRWNYSGSGDETSQVWRHGSGEGWRGRFGNGVDCSDYTALIYNWGFGIRFTSAVAQQGGQDARDATQSQQAPNMPGFHDWTGHNANGAGAAGKLLCVDGTLDEGNRCSAHGGYISVFDGQGKFNPEAVTDDMLAKLRPGDLLFIAGSAGRSRHVTHVVMWTGQKIGAGVIGNDRIAPQSDLGYPYGSCSPDAWKAENNSGTYIIVDSHYQGPDYRAFTPCFYKSQVWGVRRVF